MIAYHVQVELRLEVDGGPFFRSIGCSRLLVADVMNSGKYVDAWPLNLASAEGRRSAAGALGAGVAGGASGDATRDSARSSLAHPSTSPDKLASQALAHVALVWNAAAPPPDGWFLPSATRELQELVAAGLAPAPEAFEAGGGGGAREALELVRMRTMLRSRADARARAHGRGLTGEAEAANEYAQSNTAREPAGPCLSPQQEGQRKDAARFPSSHGTSSPPPAPSNAVLLGSGSDSEDE
eukprot:g2965.t1